MFDLVIAGGRVHLEEGAKVADVAVSGERIAEVADRIAAPARRRIDATGLEVLPGLIDPHVHLGLPAGGAVSSDDVTSGTRAALFGGVTTVIDFSLQRPGMGIAEAVEERLGEFRGRSYCDYALHANVTEFGERFAVRLPEELTRLGQLGVTSLKIFTAYSRRGMMIPERWVPVLLREAARRGFLVLVHAEEDAIVNEAADRLSAEGLRSVRDFPRTRPPEAEAEAIGRLASLARDAGAAVYFVHVSTREGLARARGTGRTPGVEIYAETCPQYLWLTAQRYEDPKGHRFLVTPPLRSAADRDALRAAIREGGIDVIATDHCPFDSQATDRPELPCTELPSGLPGIETRLPLVHTIARENGWASGPRLVELLSAAPAKIFGLYPRKGVIRPDADADLVLFDPAERWTIEAASLHMRTDQSPYEGVEVVGRVRAVVLRGRVMLDEGGAMPEPAGRELPRKPRPPVIRRAPSSD